MTGSLRPGTFMRLDETAAELGVSDEGMVQLEPHRGHVGVPMTRGDIEEVAFAEFGGSLLHVARYLPLLLYTTDQNCGVEAVASHRELIAALRRRDAETVVRLTTGPFTDGAQRLILRPEQIGLWGSGSGTWFGRDAVRIHTRLPGYPRQASDKISTSTPHETTSLRSR